MTQSERMAYFLTLKETKEMLEEKLQEFYADDRDADKKLDGLLSRLIVTRSEEKWVIELIIEMTQQQRNDTQADIRRFQRYKNMADGKKVKDGLNIERAKEVPISEILGTPKRTQGGRSWYTCPIHNGDNSPSFCWYMESNRYWCFGCSEGGSVIDLYMKINGVDFKTACKELAH